MTTQLAHNAHSVPAPPFQPLSRKSPDLPGKATIAVTGGWVQVTSRPVTFLTMFTF